MLIILTKLLATSKKTCGLPVLGVLAPGVPPAKRSPAQSGFFDAMELASSTAYTFIECT